MERILDAIPLRDVRRRSSATLSCYVENSSVAVFREDPSPPMKYLHPVAFVLVSSVFACEPRIEEPLPPARPEPPVTPLTTTESPSGEGAAPKSLAPSKCVFPTPDKPKRPPPPSGFDPLCPHDPQGNFPLRSGKVVFPEAKDKPTEINVEVAQRDVERMRGLMFRKSMAEEAGMIFLMEDHSIHRFWMHNTCIPLDMLFVDKDGVIVGIEENVPTMNDNTYSVPCPSSYVIEVNAGYCRRHGIVAGQKIQLDGI